MRKDPGQPVPLSGVPVLALCVRGCREGLSDLSGDAVGLVVGALELLRYAAALGELVAVLATPGADLLALLRRRLGDHGLLGHARCRLPAGSEVGRQSLFELLLLVWCQVYLVPGVMWDKALSRQPPEIPVE